MEVTIQECLWRFRFAKLVSKLSAPPLVIFLAAAVVTKCDPHRTCYVDLWHYGVICILIPLVVLLVLRFTGKVGDFDLTNRAERTLPMLAATSASLISWAYLSAISPGTALASFAGAQSFCLVALMLISLFWKISIHTSALATLAAVLPQYSVPLTGCVVFGLGIVGWARVFLGKHTLAQVFAGSVLSGMAILAWSLS